MQSSALFMRNSRSAGHLVTLKKTKTKIIICSMTCGKPFVACGVKISPVIGYNTINIPDKSFVLQHLRVYSLSFWLFPNHQQGSPRPYPSWSRKVKGVLSGGGKETSYCSILDGFNQGTARHCTLYKYLPLINCKIGRAHV